MTTPDLLDKILAGLRRLGDGAAVVGALDGVTATHLAYSEFGTVHAPARPTLSPATDEATASIMRSVQRQVTDVLDGRGRGTTAQEVVAGPARDLAELVRDRIDGNTQPDLAASTKAARRRTGRDTRTLVDTGDMMRGIAVESSDDPDAFAEGTAPEKRRRRRRKT